MSGSSETPAWSVVLSQTDKTGFAFVHELIESERKLSDLVVAAQQNKCCVIAGKPARVPIQTQTASVVYADLSPMKAILEHERADQVIHVETGITVAELNGLLAEHRQWWPVEVPSGWTLGETISAGSGSALQHRFGGPRELVLGARVVMPEGQILRCGGRVVKNVTGYDMTKLFVGSHGWLGLMSSVFLRLYALPETSRSLVWTFDKAEAMFAAADVLNRSGLPLSSLEGGTGSSIAASGVLGAVKDSSFVLLVRIHGSADVVGEVARGTSDLVVGHEPQELTDEVENHLWTHVALEFGVVNERISEIALPVSQMQDLARNESWSGVSSAGWMCRPSTGRLAVRAESAESVGALLGLVKEHARLTERQVAVSASDEQYNLRIHRLPNGDPVLEKLQEQLKQRFDPHRILNPFVCL